VNRSKLSLRRPLAILGAIFVGLAVAVSFAAPASAHDADLSGAYTCLPSGHWQVTWTLISGRNDHPATLDEVHYQPDNPDAKNIKAGATLAPGVPLTEVLLLPGDTTTTSLSVQLTFGTDEPRTTDASLEFTGECKKEQGDHQKPSVSFESTCDGSVDVTLHNPTDHPVTFTLTVEGSHPDDIRVDAGKTEVVRNEGAPRRIEVRWGKDGRFTAEGGFAQPDGCATVAAEFTCDSLILQIENPKGQETGQETIEVLFKTSDGDSGTVVVAPGKSATRTFPASEGFTVFVFSAALGADDFTDQFTWEQPDNCGGAAGGGEADGGGLPKTGPETTAIAGAAGVLLAAGLTMFRLARRRRIRFTA
jgi:LPXTG-motif cell wall-anchored protein